MGTPHISASVEDISKKILLVRDPLLSGFIAETLLKNSRLFSEIRGMCGFTGEYGGQTVSVLSIGLGIPSAAIYTNELLEIYGVKRIVYLDGCIPLQPDLAEGSVVLVSGCSTDSDFTRHIFPGDFAPLADYSMLTEACDRLQAVSIPTTTGSVLTSDSIFDRSTASDVWERHGVLAVDSASAAIYALAAKYHAKTLSILPVIPDLLQLKEEFLKGILTCALEILLCN